MTTEQMQGADHGHHGHHGQHSTPGMAHDHGMMDHGNMMHAPQTAGTSSGHSDHMMMMYFHGGYNEVILFDFWRISTIGGLLGSMLAVFVLGILYEGIKFYRDHVIRTSGFQPMKIGRWRRGGQKSPTTSQSAADSESSGASGQASRDKSTTEAIETVDEEAFSAATEDEGNGAVKFVQTSMLSCGHFTLTGLHFVQVSLAYILMLIVMTYNTWLCLATVLGATVGHFLFGWRKSAIVDLSDHCH